jgi:hypothetical protein
MGKMIGISCDPNAAGVGIVWRAIQIVARRYGIDWMIDLKAGGWKCLQPTELADETDRRKRLNARHVRRDLRQAFRVEMSELDDRQRRRHEINTTLLAMSEVVHRRATANRLKKIGVLNGRPLPRPKDVVALLQAKASVEAANT